MNKFIISILSLALFLGSTIFIFLDLGKGGTSSSLSRFSLIFILVAYFALFLMINLKLRNRDDSFVYALLYPLVLFIALDIYYDVYFLSKIDSEGIMTKAVVTSKENRVSGDAGSKMTANYEYIVNGEKYFKYIFKKDLDVGDTIYIKYLKSNPTFHMYISTKKE